MQYVDSGFNDGRISARCTHSVSCHRLGKAVAETMPLRQS